MSPVRQKYIFVAILKTPPQVLISWKIKPHLQWAIPFTCSKGTPPMNDRAICLPWDKSFALTPLGQTVVYGELRKIY